MRTRFGLSLILLLVMAVTFSLVAACGKDKKSSAPSEVQLDQSNAGSTVEIASGGTLIIALPSNPSTGYAWTVVDPSGGLTQQGEPTYVPPGSTQPVFGAAGTQVFRFTAGKKGEYKLGLAYERSFEPNTPPQQMFELTVNVK